MHFPFSNGAEDEVRSKKEVRPTSVSEGETLKKHAHVVESAY